MKENDASTIHCEVDLNTFWRGEQFQIVTGTCSYYVSTRMICPCACAAMQRCGNDIDKIDNVHPFYRIWYHPLWKEAIKSLHLYDYKDSPYYSLTQLEPTSIASTQDPDPMSNIKLEETMRCFNSEIFDKIGHLGNISEVQRINKMREHFHKLEKIAVKSVKSTKYAICSIVELTNRLGSLSVSTTNSNITVSAIDKALHRHQNHSLPNLSALNYLKRKVNTGSKDKTQLLHGQIRNIVEFVVITSKNHKRFIHHTVQIHQNVLISLQLTHEQKSGGNGVTDENNKELLVLNDLELLVSNPTGINVKIEKVHKDKLINLSNIIKREANINGESSDDQTTYTTADNFDPDNVSREGKCKEKIRPGEIQYYNPIFVAGDPCGLRETSVLSVDPNNYFPLVLSNGEALPSTSKVKRIKFIQHNRLVDQLGLFWSMVHGAPDDDNNDDDDDDDDNDGRRDYWGGRHCHRHRRRRRRLRRR